MLSEDYPDTAAVADELRHQIMDFDKNLPLIKCFTSDAIFDEEWNQIQKLIGPIDRDEIKVSQIIEENMNQHQEEIEEITMKAEKKFSLQKKLREMKKEMSDFQLQQNDYKGITFLIKGFDDINAKLDDQIVATQAMLGSSYMWGKLKTETKSWDIKLNNMSELMDQILKT